MKTSCLCPPFVFLLLIKYNLFLGDTVGVIMSEFVLTELMDRECFVKDGHSDLSRKELYLVVLLMAAPCYGEALSYLGHAFFCLWKCTQFYCKKKFL